MSADLMTRTRSLAVQWRLCGRDKCRRKRCRRCQRYRLWCNSNGKEAVL
ncbi:hypothetical protein [Mycobacterium heckeshornense]|nr:hypothetical protein [Mycobacterium heckeshornense]